MGPTPGMVRPEGYFPFSQSTYSPPAPSYRIRSPGHNADYAKECYSHLARVNSSDTIVNYKAARFFIIKSFTEDNVHKSMKYQVWSSTPEGNKRLNEAYIKSVAEKVPLFLFFSVNGSRQFVGVAKMTSEVDFKETFAHWQQDRKWLGKFKVEWIFIKDIPNKEFKSIIVPSNESKPVTNMKDAQEIPYEQGIIMLEKFKSYDADTSMLDGFEHYDNEERKMNDAKAHKTESFAKIPHEGGRGRGKGRRGRGKNRRAQEGKREGKKEVKKKTEGTQPIPAPETQPSTNA